ncbi:MAG: GNAT family N-acetyltransferase [Gammaproteobacteria bacterium]|nr:MAG: GNAT family N-acetyltransferase [Gammaproteobacteria bacterium]
MIQTCGNTDFEAVYQVINDAAEAYRGVIPQDRWKEPYMPREELQQEMDAGVRFSGIRQGVDLAAVMGIQAVKDVTLIRHAYTAIRFQGQGLGGRLLDHLHGQANTPLLVGTWADAVWAVRFYQGRGFRLARRAETEVLLEKYWDIPRRQVETSVVLSDVPVDDLLS